MKTIEIIFIALTVSASTTVSEGFFSWFFKTSTSETGGHSQDKDYGPGNGRLQSALKSASAPFDMQTTDEKFLLQAEVVKDLSPLDACHHLVVAAIQTTCSELSEEELGKLSVQLLNCQSESEGRKVYPCSAEMTIGQCTGDMDSTTWNAYQIVSNRARAICYATQQSQFRKKTEFTVNRLVQNTQAQILAMKALEESQEKMSEMAEDMVEQVGESQQEIMDRQQQLRQAQDEVHGHLYDNLKELMREKALLAAGNKELADISESIRDRIDEANMKLDDQDDALKQNHDEILKDLASIRDRAQQVWQKIDDNTQQVLQFQDKTSQHYRETLDNLQQVNSTISYVLQTIKDMRKAIDDRLTWLAGLVGCTEDRIMLLSVVAVHTGYLMLAAISAAFLHTPMFSRLILLVMVPLNAISQIKDGASLSIPAMTAFILLTVAANWVTQWIYCLLWSRSKASFGGMKSLPAPDSLGAMDNSFNESMDSTNNNSTEKEKQSSSLTSPDIRRLVSVLERLYNNGTLTPAVTKRPLSQSEPPKSDDPANPVCPINPPPTPMDLKMSMASGKQPRSVKRHSCLNASTLNSSDLNDSLNSSVNRPPHTHSQMNAVKRHLMKTLDSPNSKASPGRPRMSNPPTPTRHSTPIKDSPRSSRASTPNRSQIKPLCLATTKAGMPCKLASLPDSAFCRKHQVHD